MIRKRHTFVTRFCLAFAAALLAIPVAAQAAVIEKGILHIEFSDLDAKLGERAYRVLDQALQENVQRLPAGDNPIRVVVCHTLAEFGRYAGPLGMASVSGIASPEEGLIAVKAPALIQGPEDFPGILRHELLHVLLARNINLHNLPHWLNEGVSMRCSGEYRWESSLRVAEMYLQGNIISYFDLTIVLDAGRGERAFGDAYAQSLSMTTYLVEQMGEEKFWAMLHSLRTQSFGDAMRAQLGMGPGEFYEQWRNSLWKVALISSLVSGFGLFQVMAFLTIWAYVRKKRRGRRIVEGWDEEDRIFGVDSDGSDDPENDQWDDDLDILEDPDEDPDSYQPWEYDESTDAVEDTEEQKHKRGRPRGHRRGGWGR